MPRTSSRSLQALWEDSFREGLTAPGFRNLVVVLTGWVLTRGQHAITESLVVTGISGRRHWETFHRLFSRGAWSPDELGRGLFERLQRLLGDAPIRLVLDDTLAPKRGAHTFGIGNHVDAVRSTKKLRVFTFGHCWVVLAVLVRVPFSSRAWALPVLFRLFRNESDNEKHGLPHRKRTELAREMIEVFLGWTDPARRIELAADCAYCNDTVSRGLPERVVLFGVMRPDAALTALPEPKPKGKPGRQPLRGVPKRSPEEVARDGRTPWKELTAVLYGKATKVRYKTYEAQWYRAMGVRLLRVVIVECATGKIPFRVYFSLDATLGVAAILETYASRWGIEVFFRDAKQLLGFADSQARKENAVLRMAPMIGLLYSTLVIWCVESAQALATSAVPIRPWYPHKRGLSFADVLRAARIALERADVRDPASDYENLTVPKPPPDGRRKTKIAWAA